MKYKLLLGGENSVIIMDFFWHTEKYFHSLTTTDFWNDIIGHFEYFQPDVYVLFLDTETCADVAGQYYCHAGLVDFAAPIMANGKMVGSFIVGQVLTSPPDLDKFRRIAQDLGINPDEYVEAVKKVPIVDKQTVNKAAHSLYVFANVLSEIAYKSHKLYISNIEIEKASNLKSDFLANMSHEIRTPMKAVLGMVDLELCEQMSSASKGFLQQIKVSGKNLLVIINDILDFSKIESGKMEIIPDNYELFSGYSHHTQAYAHI